ncbi:MAG: extracellular solute-binding protein [Treponema sp.]|jgi:putative aldouronate transport system substrate-binding protein|nr:extracellular solute-binding protein [Treponema sp.]
MKKTKFVLAVLLAVVTTLPVMAAGRQAQSGTGSGGAVKIEAFLEPWVNQTIEGSDPYRDYINQLTGADWTITITSDFTAELTTRAVAGNLPDLIQLPDTRRLDSMYNEGILLADWTPYKASLPNAIKAMGDSAITRFTTNGKLICISTEPGDQLWAWNIRKDWLAKLGLKMPTTPDEFFNVLKAFTENDPDGNGKKDTYGLTAAGDGKNINELSNLGLMYGPTSWYVSNNNVSHPIIDGNYRKTLDFIRRVHSAGYIDPDWYTISWGDRVPGLLNNGIYGVAWYPPEALLQEGGRYRRDQAGTDWWDVMPTPKGGPDGGKLIALPIYGAINTVSATTGRDQAKMAAITKLLNEAVPLNEAYYAIRYGVGIDKFTMEMIEGRAYVDMGAGPISQGARMGEAPGQSQALWNWGKIICTYSLTGNGLVGQEPTIDSQNRQGIKLSNIVMAQPRIGNDHLLLNLNSDYSTATETLVNEFTIQYILGQTSDYDGFVRQWLASGGQALLDEATQQLKGYGRIR